MSAGVLVLRSYSVRLEHTLLLYQDFHDEFNPGALGHWSGPLHANATFPDQLVGSGGLLVP